MDINQSLDLGFSKDCRIRKHYNYQLLFRKGRRIALPHFVIYYIVNDNGHSRLGTTVSRKIGNAVVRNHCKRHLKEFFRKTNHLLNEPTDLSILARPGAANLSSLQIYQELITGLSNFSLVNIP